MRLQVISAVRSLSPARIYAHANLTERLLVKPLGCQCTRGLQGEFQAVRAHISFAHSLTQVQQKEYVSDSSTPDGSGRGE